MKGNQYIITFFKSRYAHTEYTYNSLAKFTRNLPFFFIILLSITSKSQTTNDFAESFNFFPQNSFLLIPSHVGIDTDIQTNIVYKSYFGPLSTIRTYLADVNYTISGGKADFLKKDKHIIGAGLYNDKEGEFFNRNRVMLRYAWHRQLTEKWHIAGGAAFHVVNYVFKSSNSGSNGSDFAGSGNLGVSLYTDLFKLGIATNDFNKPSVQPVDFRFNLYRFYTLHLEKNLTINHRTSVIGSLLSNYIPQGRSTQSLHVGVILSDKVGIHTFIHSWSGWGFAFGLKQLKLNDGWFDLTMSYKVPYSKQISPPSGNYEINLGYYFLRNTNK